MRLPSSLFFLAFAMATLCIAAAWSHAQETPSNGAAVNEAIPANDAYDVLTRGPVHEAFAEQVSLNPQPGLIVKDAPPQPIDEIPPTARPAGDDVQWIDGYWAWDEADSKFIWISGVWRIPPQDHQWVPGYWHQLSDGYQWISGFWASDEAGEVGYIPELPPESKESGPTGAAPSANHFWVPGSWQYANAKYVWQPGYWTRGYEGWVWVPSYYRWTPSGVIHAGNYWDRTLDARGYLFAPIRFNRPVYTTVGWHYTPQVVIDAAPLQFHLFVRPNYSHYYFGDYYGPSFVERGWMPWYRYATVRNYDPLFTYHHWQFRGRGIDFVDRSQQWFNYFNTHENFRPRHTLTAQREFVRQHRDFTYLAQTRLGDTFVDVVKNDRGTRFVSLDDDQHKMLSAQRDRLREFRTQRAEVEMTKPDVDQSESLAEGGATRRDNLRRERVLRLQQRAVATAIGQRDVREGNLRPNGREQHVMRVDPSQSQAPQTTPAPDADRPTLSRETPRADENRPLIDIPRETLDRAQERHRQREAGTFSRETIDAAETIVAPPTERDVEIGEQSRDRARTVRDATTPDVQLGPAPERPGGGVPLISPEGPPLRDADRPSQIVPNVDNDPTRLNDTNSVREPLNLERRQDRAIDRALDIPGDNRPDANPLPTVRESTTLDDHTRPRQPSPGGLVRPDVTPRGGPEVGSAPERRRMLPTPGAVRPGIEVPDNSRQGADVPRGGGFGTQPSIRRKSELPNVAPQPRIERPSREIEVAPTQRVRGAAPEIRNAPRRERSDSPAVDQGRPVRGPLPNVQSPTPRRAERSPAPQSAPAPSPSQSPAPASGQ